MPQTIYLQLLQANIMTTYLIECKGPVREWMPTKLHSCPTSQRNHLNRQVHRLVKYKIHLYCHMKPPCILKVKGNIQLLGDLQGFFCSYLHHSGTYKRQILLLHCTSRYNNMVPVISYGESLWLGTSPELGKTRRGQLDEA